MLPGASGFLEAVSSLYRDVLLHPCVETEPPARTPSLSSVAFGRNVLEPSGLDGEFEGQLRGLGAG